MYIWIKRVLDFETTFEGHHLCLCYGSHYPCTYFNTHFNTLVWTVDLCCIQRYINSIIGIDSGFNISLLLLFFIWYNLHHAYLRNISGEISLSWTCTFGQPRQYTRPLWMGYVAWDILYISLDLCFAKIVRHKICQMRNNNVKWYKIYFWIHNLSSFMLFIIWF